MIRQIRFIFLSTCLCVFLGNCTGEDKESDHSRTVRLLTDNDAKIWVLDQKFEDDVTIDFTECDSSYQLTIHSDFTWSEQHLNANCGGISTGSWDLNEDNSVLITHFQSFLSSDIIERKFEIIELNETTFSYQFTDRNSLLLIKLKEL